MEVGSKKENRDGGVKKICLRVAGFADKKTEPRDHRMWSCPTN